MPCTSLRSIARLISRDPRLQGTPFAADLAKTPEQHQALDLFLARTNVGRPFISPPGVPANRLAILRTAFAETMKDPGLLQEAESSGLHPLYISPDELTKFVGDAYKASPQTVAMTKKALGR